MTAPKDFRVRQLPQTLAQLTGQDGDGRRRWVEVEGGGLPGRVAVGIDRTEDGRFIVSGIVVGRQGGGELTWQQLRGIRPATLLSWIFEGFDPQRPAALTAEVVKPSMQQVDGVDFDQEAWERDDEPLPAMRSGQVWHDIRKMTPGVLWTELVSGPSAGQPRVESRATAGATDLEEFAEVYRRHYAVTPHRATAATAKEYSMSRATVIRRLAAAREAGLLPPADPRLGGRPRKGQR